MDDADADGVNVEDTSRRVEVDPDASWEVVGATDELFSKRGKFGLL